MSKLIKFNYWYPDLLWDLTVLVALKVSVLDFLWVGFLCWSIGALAVFATVDPF